MRINRGELLTTRLVLSRHREIIELAIRDRDRGSTAADAATALDDVRGAIERVLDGWRPNAGNGG